MKRVVTAPQQRAVVQAPDCRRMRLKVFRFDVICREVGGTVQVLAIAHHRREPGYWSDRS